MNQKYFVEKNIHHTLDNRFFSDNCYYDGYWQSYKYVKLVENALNAEMKIYVSFCESDSDILRKIMGTESVGIHIRRGDYISNKYNRRIFGSFSPGYYLKSINLIKQKLINAEFYVFSDDINWAREQDILNHCTFVEGNRTLEDFYLMSLCKHNIIANSTFSWWAAWLNKNPQKIVIAPENWYNGNLNKDTVDLVPESWIKL
jgi:hypothetical protein